ncbi:MAG: CzcE family metal-binding protein [Herminiimonas sp.]|nr:CzcE family metal-binding protein [Herminiimonas sp.]
MLCALAGSITPAPVAAEQRIDLLGDPVVAPIGRPLRIDAATRYVNVEGGEVIRFDVNGRSFSWSFSGPLAVTSFNLRRIAPPGMLDHDVIVYIAPNPYYSGPT